MVFAMKVGLEPFQGAESSVCKPSTQRYKAVRTCYDLFSFTQADRPEAPNSYQTSNQSKEIAQNSRQIAELDTHSYIGGFNPLVGLDTLCLCQQSVLGALEVPSCAVVRTVPLMKTSVPVQGAAPAGAIPPEVP